MHKKMLIAGLLLSIALPLAAEADNEHGWYGVLSLGVSSYGNSQEDEDNIRSDLNSQGILADVHVDDNPSAIGVGLGNHFSDNFALEANYIDLGDATAHVHVFSPSDFDFREHLHASGVTLDAIGLTR